MSAPNETPPARSGRRRRWWTGLAAAVAVLVAALVVLALLPRSATATASLTVTPRTDAGAAAALLLADRYTALAGSTSTLRSARAGDPALAGIPLDRLADGTAVEREQGTATITVRVTLPDRNTAAAAANAVVDTLVATGADESLVDVDRGAEADPSRADTSPDVLRWVLVALLVSLACGVTVAALAGRASHPGPPPAPSPTPTLPRGGPAPGPDADEVLDDLPGFLENPPGSLPVLPAAAEFPVTAPVTALVTAPVDPPATTAAAGSAASGEPDVSRSPATASRHGAVIGTATAVAVLVTAAVVVAVTAGRSREEATAAPSSAVTATLTPPTESPAPGLDPTVPTTSAPPSATETVAAALAFQSVPLGRNGVAASVTFQGVVLEQRAVGLTVTYPSISVSTDGRRSLAHVRLPTFNCLTAEPPADPVTAGCARSLTEYADLASPALQVSRDGDRLDVLGLFPTYTRANGSAPAYTGRAYQLTAAISGDGPERDGRAPAAGVVRIGLDSAPTTADRGVNLLQLPG